ncbi:MAG: Rrf2 family transcriptional regulator [Lentisphaeria bacterium]|nr:Rrf2 family transcriptional regulator [Lentisphaeria bacterium]
MRLTSSTDYAFRIMIFAGRMKNNRVTTQKLSESLGVTQANVNKIVNILKHKGYLDVQRGRYGGGIILNEKTKNIPIGKLIVDLEPDMAFVQCMSHEKNTCPLTRNCTLAGLFGEGLHAFVEAMNQKTLGEVI